MEISPNAAVAQAVAMQQSEVKQQVDVSMLKKSMDIQAQGALALIEALPSVPSSQGLPAHIGNNVNTTA